MTQPNKMQRLFKINLGFFFYLFIQLLPNLRLFVVVLLSYCVIRSCSF
jgi:hypothetical protein